MSSIATVVPLLGFEASRPIMISRPCGSWQPINTQDANRDMTRGVA